MKQWTCTYTGWRPVSLRRLTAEEKRAEAEGYVLLFGTARETSDGRLTVDVYADEDGGLFVGERYVRIYECGWERRIMVWTSTGHRVEFQLTSVSDPDVVRHARLAYRRSQYQSRRYADGYW